MRSARPSLVMHPAFIAINRVVLVTLHGWSVPSAREASIHDPDSFPEGCSDSLHLPFPWRGDNLHNGSSNHLADSNTYERVNICGPQHTEQTSTSFYLISSIRDYCSDTLGW